MQNLPIAFSWTDPYGLIAARAKVFLYFVRVTDASGDAYCYIGKTKNGKSRLREYRRNIEKIFAGRPRRVTLGQEKYRAVHLALAKACELGWNYEFYPLEEVELSRLNVVEQQRISELSCNLNSGCSWSVGNYQTLTIRDLL